MINYHISISQVEINKFKLDNINCMFLVHVFACMLFLHVVAWGVGFDCMCFVCSCFGLSCYNLGREKT